MKITTRFFCLGIFLTGMPWVSPGAPSLFDNFDSYANDAAFDVVWTDSVGSGLSLNTAIYSSSPNSVWNANYASASAQSRQQMASASALALDFSFDFYDPTGGNNLRDYGMIYSRVGDLWSGALNNILGIGMYNSLLTSSYYGRISSYTGVIFGDGITVNSSGWFDLGGAANRSVGWHEARITGEADPDHAGMALYKFYIDGVLGGSVANAKASDYNWVVLGSGISTTAGAIAFDNVSVAAIPESSVILFSLFGMVVVCLKRLQRRRS